MLALCQAALAFFTTWVACIQQSLSHESLRDWSASVSVSATVTSGQMSPIHHWWNKRHHQERWICQSDKQFARRWKDLQLKVRSQELFVFFGLSPTGKLDFVVFFMFGLFMLTLHGEKWTTGRTNSSHVSLFGNLSSHQVKGLIPAAVTAANHDGFVYILRCNWPSLVFS